MKKIKTYLDFLSENKKEIDKNSIPIEIEDKKTENDNESEEENTSENQ